MVFSMFLAIFHARIVSHVLPLFDAEKERVERIWVILFNAQCGPRSHQLIGW